MNFFELCEPILTSASFYSREPYIHTRLVTREAFLNKYKWYRVSKCHTKNDYYIEPFRLIDPKKGFESIDNIICGKAITYKKISKCDLFENDWIELDEIRYGSCYNYSGSISIIDEKYWNLVMSLYESPKPLKNSGIKFYNKLFKHY